MARTMFLSAALLFGAGVHAAYNPYFFATEASNWQCSDMNFKCVPPQVCAFDNVLNKYICCDSAKNADVGAVCWGQASNCNANTINCGDDANRFCCIAEKEVCTKKKGQVNICWASGPDPVAHVGNGRMNDTYTSLLSASPSATQLTVDVESLLATSSTPTSTPISSGASTLSTSNGPPPTGTSENANDGTGRGKGGKGSGNSGPSTGVLVGAVIGGIVGLALIVGGIFLLMRRRRAATKGSELDSNPYAGRADVLAGGYAKADGHYPPQTTFAHEAAGQQAPVEIGAGDRPAEMEGSRPVRL